MRSPLLAGLALSLAACASAPPLPVFEADGPVQVNEGEALTVVVGLPPDADGEGLVLSLTDDVGELSESVTLDASGRASFEVRLAAEVTALTATLTDDDARTSSASLAMDVNALPRILSLELDPEAPTTTSDLVPVVEAVDPDATGPLEVRYAWFEDDVLLEDIGDTLPAARTVKGRTYRVVATPSDGRGEGETAEAARTVGNSPPVLDAVTIAPDADVTTRQALSCSWQGSDPDEDALTAEIAWTVDGRALGAEAALQLDPTAVSPEDEVVCTVTLSDPDGASDVSSASVVVQNTPPTLDGPTLDPSAEVTTRSRLTCSATPDDLDGEVPDLGFTWSIAGVAAGTGPTLDLTPETASPEDEVQCTATATDGYGGVASASVDVALVNTAPTVDLVAITPSTAVTTSTTVSCAATVTDLDGEEPTVTYAWEVGGTPLGTADTLVLDPDQVRPEQVLTCTATAEDGFGGVATGSSDVTIENTPPQVTSVSVTPGTGVTTSTTLTCAVTATDDDGEVPTLDYAWSIDGTPVGTGATLALDTDTVSPEDEVVCTATATDGYGGSDSYSDSIEVENTPPVVESTTVTPSGSVFTGDSLTCEATASDADGETPTITYAWSVGGTTVATGSTWTVDPDDSDPGDSITCTATAEDAYGGSDDRTASVTLRNSPPRASLSVSPGFAVADDATVTCTLTATDPDEDSLTTTLGWEDATGSSVGSAGVLDLSKESPSDGDRYTCTGTATDPGGLTATNAVTVVVGDRRVAGTLDFTDADAFFTTDWGKNYSGFSPGRDGVVVGFDFDGDGHGDLAFGDYTGLGDVSGSARQTGMVNLVFGTGSRFSGETFLSRVGSVAYGIDNLDDASRVAPAGDVDDDGYDDLLIGAYGRSNVASNAGAVHLLLGRKSPAAELDLATESAFTLEGEAVNDFLGAFVAGPVDFDGDGYDDIVTSAVRYDGNATDAGAVVIQHGSASLSGTVALSKADVVLLGMDAGDLAGTALDAGGDLDGDGNGDVIIGAYEAETAYVVLGDSTWSGENDLDDADVVVDGSGVSAPGRDAQVGWEVGLQGDFDDDGYADALITAPGTSPDRDVDGGAFLVFGSASPSASLDLAKDYDIRWDGEDGEGGLTGRDARMGGDIDGDGYDDLLLGAPWVSVNASRDGTVYVLYGAASTSGIIDLGTITDRIDGDMANATMGFDRHISTIGDLDGDGAGDFVLLQDRSAECSDDGCLGLFYGG